MRGPAASQNARPLQLALALGHQESLAREDFLEGPSNRTALTLVEAWPDWTRQSGSVEVVLKSAATGLVAAGADPRRPAYAIAG